MTTTPVLSTPDTITFPVDDVTPGTEPLEKTELHKIIDVVLAQEKGGTPWGEPIRPIEACSDYYREVLSDSWVSSHGLAVAIYLAYANHRPLVLSPDALWLAILQGVSNHIWQDPEKYRPLFVDHVTEEMNIEIVREDLVKGNPANPWHEVAEEMRERIGAHVKGDTVSKLRPKFSTTGLAEGLAFDVTIMDALGAYFSYDIYCICGIPEITLTGTVEDWKDLNDRVQWLHNFEELDLQWWTKHLVPIADQFIEARKGNPDTDFWQHICKYKGAYGGPVISGWCAQLVPYLKDGYTLLPTERSQALTKMDTTETWTDIFTKEQVPVSWIALRQMPVGIAKVPFHWKTSEGDHEMELLGGFFGVTENENGALSPYIGWAVRDQRPFDAVINGLAEFGTQEGAHKDQLAAACSYHRCDFHGINPILTALLQRANGFKLPNGIEIFGLRDWYNAFGIEEKVSSERFVALGKTSDGRRMGVAARAGFPGRIYIWDDKNEPLLISTNLKGWLTQLLDDASKDRQPYFDQPDFEYSCINGDESKIVKGLLLEHFEKKPEPIAEALLHEIVNQQLPVWALVNVNEKFLYELVDNDKRFDLWAPDAKAKYRKLVTLAKYRKLVTLAKD